MDVQHYLDPTQAPIQGAAGAGTFIVLAVTRNIGWLFAILLLFVGQVSAYYFTIPIANWLGWFTPRGYGVIGLTIGVTAMFFWTAVIKLGQNLGNDPLGTIGSIWRIWRGNSSNPDK